MLRNSANGALIVLSKTIAMEVGPYGVRCYCLVPGAIDTPMLWSNPNLASGAETLAPEDVGSPADVAAAALFLASDEARFITGSSLEVSGGRLARL